MNFQNKQVLQPNNNSNGQQPTTSQPQDNSHLQDSISIVHNPSTNGGDQVQKSSSEAGVQSLGKRERSKEDVDAGNTLLSFLQELRNNHNKALSMGESNDNIHQSKKSSKNAEEESNSIHGSLSDPPKSQSDSPMHSRNEVTDSGSSLSGGDSSRSENANKAESIRSESSTESGSNDTLSEDDQKQEVIQKGLMGPIRKRFRRAEFSLDIMKKPNNIPKN